MAEQQAMGLIETMGLVPALAGADAACKAAGVRIVRRVRMKGSPFTTIWYEGDVAAVTSAMEAGAAAARQVGTVLSVHVIARPADGLDPVLGAGAAPAPAPARRRRGAGKDES